MSQLRVFLTSGSVPNINQLSIGDIGINSYDGRAFIKKQVGLNQTIIELGAGVAVTSASYAQNSTNATNAVNATNATNAISASYALSSSYASLATTASYFSGSISNATYAVSASYALTASYLEGFVTSASYATTSSYVTTSSYAIYAETASSALNAQDILIYVKNQSGNDIAKGVVVHITASGNSSDIPRIITASYENDNNSANTLGITNQIITNGGEGYVMTEGVLKGIDTNAYVSGQLIYLGATGSITGSAPRAPLHSVRLGQVVRHQSNNGSIYVRIDNGYELGELHDVLDNTTSSSYGDLLVKSGSVWISSRSLTGSYSITGSLIISGSSTFTNIGPSILSGSVTGTSGFTGSFTGSLTGLANSASYAVQAGNTNTIDINSFSTSVESYLLMSNVVATTGVAIGGDTELRYNSSTNVLTVPNISGSLLGTSSFAQTSLTASYVLNAISSSFALTSSFVQTSQTASYVLNAISSSFSSTASFVRNSISSSFASTASSVNILNQNVVITGSLAIATGSIGSGESALVVGPSPAGGTGEGGQIALLATGGTYTSSSFIDNYQNQFRVLKGPGTTSNGGALSIDLQTLGAKFEGAVTASAYSGLPNDYLYATRNTTQNIGSGNWANQDVVFNNLIIQKGIPYNITNGLATLTGGKVYRITARVAWAAAASYTFEISCYDSTNTQIGPTAQQLGPGNGSFNSSDGTLDFIYAPSGNTNIKIRTTPATNALTGESIRGDLNTQLIIQQIA